jgi:hypothetical protein
MAPDCVVLEVAFLKLKQDPNQDPELWRQIDEQHISTDLRRRLKDNGLRCGLVGMQLPGELRQLLDENPSMLELVSSGVSPEGSELATRRNRLQIRAGNAKRMPVTTAEPDEFVVLLSQDDSVRAKRYEKPRGTFQFRSFPLGDGRVRLELTPEIEHGESRQHWVGDRGALLRTNDRARQTFEELTIKTVLSPGQTLLVTCTPEPKGLGNFFFATTHSGGNEQILMLTRLSQTQIDDLFCPDDVLSQVEPLAPDDE